MGPKIARTFTYTIDIHCVTLETNRLLIAEYRTTKKFV
jgi:hypothetical protein